MSRAWARAAALALCAVSAAPAAGAPHDAAAREQTRALMQELVAGIFGGKHGAGYLGDMGEPPAPLERLAAASGTPAYTTSGPGGVGMGYNGPYVSRAGASDASFVDAWGMPIAVETTASGLRLRSAGPDRDSSTPADNVYVPLQPRTTHGRVEVEVFAMTWDGLPAGVLGAGEVGVTVHYSASGGAASAAAAYAAASGRFERDGIHLGQHYVEATALEPADFTVASASDVVQLRGRGVRTRLRLVLAPGAGEQVCHDPGGPSPETRTVTQAALSEHLDHGDVAGPCPAAVPEPPPAAPPGEPEEPDEPPAPEEPPAEPEEPPATETTLCHRPYGPKPKTITASGGALEAHLSHGDTIGACPGDTGK